MGSPNEEKISIRVYKVEGIAQAKASAYRTQKGLHTLQCNQNRVSKWGVVEMKIKMKIGPTYVGFCRQFQEFEHHSADNEMF